MKKITAILLSAALMLSLTACGKDEKSESSDSKDKSYSENSKNSDPVFPDSSDDTSDPEPKPEPLKDLEMFEFLPEIPVTDVSAFKYRYDEDKGGIVITDFLTEETKIRIPDTIEGKPVVALRLNEEFGDYGGELPEGIFSYDEVSGYKKYDITELILPDTVTEIRSPSFNNYHGFSCDSPVLDKVEYINIPSGFSHTGAAFRGLKSVYFGNDTEYLYPDIFKFSKDSIEKLYIPSSVSAFSKYYLMSYEWVAGEVTYSPCPNLKEIYYRGNTYNGYTDELHHLINDVYGNGFIINKYDTYYDGSTNVVMVMAFFSDRADVVIPDGVTDISEQAFNNCSTMKTVTFPASVKRFRGEEGHDYYCCFENCDNLTSVKFEEGCRPKTLVGFNNCQKLESIVIPEGVVSIGDSLRWVNAFQNCPSLKSVTIPDSVTDVSEFSFRGCTNITEITFGDNVDTKGINWKEIFADCQNNAALKINYKGSTVSNFTQLQKLADGYSIKDGFVFKDGVLYDYWGNEEYIVIPDEITVIEAGAFGSKSYNIKGITVPASVKEIRGYYFPNAPYYAGLYDTPFGGMGNLEKLVFRGTLKKISKYAFAAYGGIFENGVLIARSSYNIDPLITYNGKTFEKTNDFFKYLDSDIVDETTYDFYEFNQY